MAATMITEQIMEAQTNAPEKTVMTRKRHKMPILRKEWPKIRDTKLVGSKGRFVVDLRPHLYEGASRLYFGTYEAAALKAKQLAIEHRNKGTESIEFPTALRVEAAECNAMLRPYGVSLRTAVEHYIRWSRDERHRNESRIVKECIAEYLVAREMHHKSGELSAISLKEIRTRVKQFQAVWGEMPIRTITRRTVTGYLDNQQAAGMKPNSRINIRANMSAFFNFCVEREWIDQSPCVRIKIKVTENEVTILTVEQATALMKAAAACKHADKMVPYFAVCLFAGLRPSEAMRLDWSRIRFEDGRIEILGHTSKIRRRRWAKIEANGLDWLRPYSKPSGLIVAGISDVTWKRYFNSIRMAAGLIPNPEAEEQSQTEVARVWDQDIMRHSFASYWLAVNKNAPELAEIMGNSVPIIRRHYENTVLETVAAGYWAI